MGLCGSSHPVAATGTPASSSTAAGGTSPPPPPPQPPPDYLLCPLTGELMAEPVLAPSGHTYERVAIKAFLIARSCDPITGMPMTVDELKPNTALQKAIEDFDKTGARYFKRAPAEIQASVAAASGGTATSGTTHAHLPATAAATAAAATAAAATAAAAAAAGATSPAPLARDRPPPSTASPSSAMPRCFQCGAEAVTRTRVGMDSWVPACEACTAAIKQGSGRFGSNSATTKTTASPRTITASSSSATGGQGALGRFLSGGEEELKEAVAMSSSSSSSIASSGGGSTQAAGGGGGGVGPGRRKSALDRFLMGSADVEAKTDAMPASASPYLAASSPPQPSSSFQAASPAFPFGTEGKTDPIPVDRPAASNGSSACSSNNYNLDGSSASNRDGSNCGAGEASSRVRGVDKVDWRHVVDRPAPAPGDDGRWERWWCRKCDCHTFRQSFERSTVCQCGHGEMYHREKDEKPLHLLAAVRLSLSCFLASRSFRQGLAPNK